MYPKFCPPIVLIAFAVLIQIIQAKSSLDVTITNITYNICDYEVLKSFDIISVKFNGRSALNVSFAFKVPITNMQTQFVLKFVKSDKKQVPIIDMKVDVCKFLVTTYETNNNLLKFISSGVRHSISLPHNCPFAADTDYSLDNFEIISDQMPIVMPDFKFTSVVNMYTNKKKFNEIYVSGHKKK